MNLLPARLNHSLLQPFTVALSAVLILGAVIASAAPAQSAGRRLTVYVAGDSTASIYDSTLAPRTGWGQALPVFAGPQVTIQDQALSGASSKSFVDLGRLKTILSTISRGDYLLISFGHNDAKTDAERHTDPYTTYQDYLLRYITGARQRGAQPILVTSVERRRFDAAGHARLSHGEYPEAMRQLGASEAVPVVDLTTLSRDHWEMLGSERTKDVFLWLDPLQHPNYPDGVQDNTHFQAHGAIEVARLIAQDLQRQKLMPAGTLVGLNRPVPDNAITWPTTHPVS